jgi:hypothetical protein
VNPLWLLERSEPWIEKPTNSWNPKKPVGYNSKKNQNLRKFEEPKTRKLKGLAFFIHIFEF